MKPEKTITESLPLAAVQGTLVIHPRLALKFAKKDT